MLPFAKMCVTQDNNMKYEVQAKFEIERSMRSFMFGHHGNVTMKLSVLL